MGLGMIARLRHEGKVILERDVPMYTAADIRAHMEKMKLVGAGRRVVIKQGSEMRLLDQLPPNLSLGLNVETKSIPGGTIKGLGYEPS